MSGGHVVRGQMLVIPSREGSPHAGWATSLQLELAVATRLDGNISQADQKGPWALSKPVPKVTTKGSMMSAT
jgi:hypothetical protein